MKCNALIFCVTLLVPAWAHADIMNFDWDFDPNWSPDRPKARLDVVYLEGDVRQANVVWEFGASNSGIVGGGPSVQGWVDVETETFDLTIEACGTWCIGLSNNGSTMVAEVEKALAPYDWVTYVPDTMRIYSLAEGAGWEYVDIEYYNAKDPELFYTQERSSAGVIDDGVITFAVPEPSSMGLVAAGLLFVWSIPYARRTRAIH